MKRIKNFFNLFLVVTCLLIPARSLSLEDWIEQGLSLSKSKRFGEAIKAFSKAIQANPRDTNALYHRGIARYYKGDYAQAIADYTKALNIDPNFADAYNQLAWTMATCPDYSHRNGAKAMELAQKAVELAPDANTWNTLAAAYAEAGRFEDAITTQKWGIALKKMQGETGELAGYIERLKSYRARVPWREQTFTTERQDKESPRIKTLKVPFAYILEQPTDGSPIVDKLGAGDKVSLIHQENGWYIVKLESGRLGWAHQSLFREEGPAPEFMKALLAKRKKAENGKKVTFKFPVSHVRSSPSLDSKIKFLMKKGESASIIEKNGDWYRVELEGGRLGWAHQSLFSEEGLAPELAEAVSEKMENEEPFPEGYSKPPAENKDRGTLKESSEEGLKHPYSVYLASFRTLKRTKKGMAIYGGKGLSPYWVKVDLGDKGVWYRLFTGHFENRPQAESFRKELELTEAKIKKTKYANLIGTFISSYELENQILSLEKIGYSPYLIEGHDGKSRLFVGAFLTKAGAERQYHDLKSSGIQNQVIIR